MSATNETEHTRRMRRKKDNPEWVRFSEAIRRSQGTEAEALLHELLADAKEERDVLLAALKAARDVLVGYQKQAGWLPEQNAYSTRMTEAERNIGRAVADIDTIIASVGGNG
jgi:hypothetical protein